MNMSSTPSQEAEAKRKPTKYIEVISSPEYPDHIRVDGIVYDLHFTADGDFTYCVISRDIKRWYGGTVRSPKDASDAERGRREAFLDAVNHIMATNPISDIKENKIIYDSFRRAYWKACQKIKEQK